MSTARILIVDRSRDTAELLADFLRASYEVEITSNSQEALDKFQEAHQQHQGFDVVITSLQMPASPDGIGLVKQLKEMTRDVAAIIFTGADDPLKYTVEAFRNGADDYVLKRAGWQEELLERVKRCSENLRNARIVTRIGATEQDVTVLFADLEGYTSLVPQMSLVEVAGLVDSCLIEMSDVVYLYDGVVDNFIGDEIFAIFEDLSVRHNTRENHAVRAVKASLEILSRVQTLEILSRVQTETQAIHIGIATGRTILGGFGPLRRRQYTALGPVVNVAARLRSKACGGQILISEDTYQAFEPAGQFNTTEEPIEKELKGVGLVRFREVQGLR